MAFGALEPDLKPGLTRVESVMAAVEARIGGRHLAPGARLPSVRAFAESLGVSKSTVVEAYDRLAAQGAIVSRPGSGFYVAGRLEPFCLASAGPRLDRAVDPLWISRQSFETYPDVLKPVCGWLPPAWMPEEALRRALRHVAREGGPALTGLRRAARPRPVAPVSRPSDGRAGRRRASGPDRADRFGDPGPRPDLPFPDRAGRHRAGGRSLLLQLPSAAAGAARQDGRRSLRPQGPDLAAFEAALRAHRPRFYLTNSALHNPTGASLGPAIVHRVLRLAEAHDSLVVEDDIYADFELEPAARLAGFDGLDRVIQIGGFSKTLSSAARIGYVALRRDWVERFLDLKVAVTLGDPHLAACVVHRAVTDASYRHDIETMRARLAEARGRAVRRLAALGIDVPFVPGAGMFLWARLPDGLDAAEVSRRALAERVILAPGNVFSVSQGAADYLRFNVAQCADPRVFSVLERAMAR